MKKINYIVECDTTKLNYVINNFAKYDSKYLEKQLSLIILKRRELRCYENCKTNTKH